MPRVASFLAAAVVLAVGLIARGGCAADTSPNDESAAAAMKSLKVQTGETVIFLKDLHCATCAKKVTSSLYKLKGVKRVRTSVKLDAAVVTPQAKKPLDAAAAWAALQKAGYQPTRLHGPEGVFVPHEETNEPLKIAEAPARPRS